MAKPNVAEEVENRPDGLTIFESKLVNLLALQLVQERKQPDQISLLNRVGFRPIEIAALLGTTPNTVRVEMSNQKREKKRTTKRKTKK